MNDHADTLKVLDEAIPLVTINSGGVRSEYQDECAANDLRAKLTKVRDAIAALEAGRSGEAERVLAALGHQPKVSDRCTAHVVPTPPEKRPPGPSNPPTWCMLKAGHDGPHRCIRGGGPSFPFRESDPVEFREPVTVCAKCRTRWPCPDAEKVIAAAPQQPPPVGVTDAIRGVIVLLRQREPDNGEKYTEHDEGYEQASSEIADMLERILTAHQQPAPSVSRPEYPKGDVVGPCVCGSWPGGPCLRCEWIPAAPAPEPAYTKDADPPHTIGSVEHSDLLIPVETSSKLGDADSDDRPASMYGLVNKPDAAGGEGLPELPESALQEQREYLGSVYNHYYTADQMRAYAIEARRITTTGQPPEPFAFRYVRESIEHCVSANEEGEDFAISRPMIDALTTLGLLEKVGRGLWAPTEDGKALAANAPATTGQGDVL